MKNPRLSPRKAPRQQRSAQLVEDILKGAIRVLKRQGGRRFTTIRVAEETGISVGSLYQYFPNKESILFQVQHREWLETSGMLLAILAQRKSIPERRLRRMIQAFFASEWEEASLRKALLETGVTMDETKVFREMSERIFERMTEFVGEFLPRANSTRRRFAAEFIFTTVSALAEEVTTTASSAAEVRRWATQCSDMVLAYLGARKG